VKQSYTPASAVDRNIFKLFGSSRSGKEELLEMKRTAKDSAALEGSAAKGIVHAQREFNAEKSNETRVDETKAPDDDGELDCTDVN